MFSAKFNHLAFAASVIAGIAFSAPAWAVELLTPSETLETVHAGKAVLIDIRTPGEWADTGIAVDATPIDMSSPQFIADLKGVIAANPGKQLAFVCRSGNRSGQLTAQLEAAGLTNIIDVKGGMNNWIGQGLPVKDY